MTRRPTVLPLVAALLLPVAAAATPEQDLARAFTLFDNHRWLPARNAARAYLDANGPRFSAAFIVAASECMLHPHQPANAAPFRALRVDYVIPDSKRTSITSWSSYCASPPPAPVHEEAGVSVSGLTMLPGTRVATPSPDEPAPRHPRVVPPPPPPPPPPPRVTATPAIIAPVVVAPVVVAPPSDTCVAGYVWREAFARDHVCVTPATRADAADDNARAGERRDPGGAYGPNTCVQGFVWREARPGDAVCVVPERRSQAAADNAQAAARRVR